MSDGWIFFLKDKAQRIVKSFPNGTNTDINRYCIAHRIPCYWHTIECPSLLNQAGYTLELHQCA